MTEKRYAIMNGNTVIDAVLWDAAAHPEYVYPFSHTGMVQHDAAMPGWTLNAGVWAPPPEEEPDPNLEPKLDNIYPPLEKWRFWSIVRMPGSIGEANLRGAIAAHPDGAFSAIALSMLDDPPGGMYWRSNPLFANAAFLGSLGLNEAAVNAMWDSAHALAAP
jgi:hypothetical protein